MLALLGLLVWACSSNNIDIENMRCEYQISPIGIDSPAPRFTWNYTTNNEDATEFSQDSYQLYIATREQDLRNSSDNSGNLTLFTLTLLMRPIKDQKN